MTEHSLSTGVMILRKQKNRLHDTGDSWKERIPPLVCNSFINTLRFHKVLSGGAYLNCSHPDPMCSIALAEGASGLSQE